MKCADEVLGLRQVDARLAADRRVDLTDECRGHGDPGDAAHVRRRDEAREVGRGAASDRDERRAPVEEQRAPEALRLCDRLRRLTGRDRVLRLDPVQLRDALVRHDGVAPDLAM